MKSCDKLTTTNGLYKTYKQTKGTKLASRQNSSGNIIQQQLVVLDSSSMTQRLSCRRWATSLSDS